MNNQPTTRRLLPWGKSKVDAGVLAELQGQLAAVDNVMAVIEFDLDGTILNANGNFLDTLGYRLEEIKGQHHGMLVDPSYRSSEEYRQFWAKLRGGQAE